MRRKRQYLGQMKNTAPWSSSSNPTRLNYRSRSCADDASETEIFDDSGCMKVSRRKWIVCCGFSPKISLLRSIWLESCCNLTNIISVVSLNEIIILTSVQISVKVCARTLCNAKMQPAFISYRPSIHIRSENCLWPFHIHKGKLLPQQRILLRHLKCLSTLYAIEILLNATN